MSNTCALAHMGTAPAAPFRVTFADQSWVMACEDHALPYLELPVSYPGLTIELAYHTCSNCGKVDLPRYVSPFCLDCGQDN